MSAKNVDSICKLYKNVKICKIMEIRLIQVIHIKIGEKGGKIEVFKNLSTLSTSKQVNLGDYSK